VSPEIEVLRQEILLQIVEMKSRSADEHKVLEISGWPREMSSRVDIFRTLARSPKRVEDVFREVESEFPYGVGDITASGLFLQDFAKKF